ncbi:MAG: hypothetical protein AB7E36_03685 [Salinivirgaceae bacterium]
MKLNINVIEKYFAKIVDRAENAISCNKIEKACKELYNASFFAYSFNHIYADERCEKIIQQISKAVLYNKTDFSPNKNRIVFYDDFSIDNRGLTLQYIRALINNRSNFLYVFGKGKNYRTGTAIIEELEAYNGARIIEINTNLNYKERICSIYDTIADFAPAKALIHIAPQSLDVIAAFYAIPQVLRFNINLTDHAFWLGSSMFDYNIEFRNYGATVSYEKRGFKENQLLLLPYYPICMNKPFQGFPEQVKDKVKIFSGGALYKVYGDQGKYFEMIKRILNDNPQVVFLYAGEGKRKYFNDFIRKNKLSDRVFLLGNRIDINEVFKNSDIYLGTYPFTGGLMSQYAAVNEIPILAYTEPRYQTNYVEEIICHQEYKKITFDDLSEFYEAANKLCSDKKVRQEYGEKLKQCVIPQEQFEKELKHILDHNKSIRSCKINEEIDYNAFADLYIEVENKFQSTVTLFLFKCYRFKTLFLFPIFFFRSFKPVIMRIINKK